MFSEWGRQANIRLLIPPRKPFVGLSVKKKKKSQLLSFFLFFSRVLCWMQVRHWYWVPLVAHSNWLVVTDVMPACAVHSTNNHTLQLELLHAICMSFLELWHVAVRTVSLWLLIKMSRGRRRRRFIFTNVQVKLVRLHSQEGRKGLKSTQSKLHTHYSR